MKTFKAGTNINQGTYESFQPNFIHRKWVVEDMEMLTLLSQADRQLGRLDTFSDYVPNINLYIQMHVVKEATQSSKIEGTQTNIEEAILDKNDVEEEKRDDWDEVQNYINALNSAIEKLNHLPFSSRLIRDTHQILLQGVRGKDKLPGDFRTSQNWIGGASINDATFVPPIHSSVSDYMSDLEKFAHDSLNCFPELLKIALIHYQFETIHPFLDGNGRIGRLMIPLYLVEKEILKKPILYLSDFFERNRMLYYDNLMRVRQKDDIAQWFKFFLVGIIETAKSGVATFDGILKLQKEVEDKISTLGSRAKSARVIIDYLYKRPIIDAHVALEILDATPPTIYKLLDSLEELGILTEITGNKRGKRYRFQEYIDLFK